MSNAPKSLGPVNQATVVFLRFHRFCVLGGGSNFFFGWGEATICFGWGKQKG